mmetsp:Transcript_70942/g.140801  ORF Transcript_70942/g.140801 Transcript_70942/m.140801 type:complete len:194 (-) Transcript_70942:2169-2750(-)
MDTDRQPHPALLPLLPLRMRRLSRAGARGGGVKLRLFVLGRATGVDDEDALATAHSGTGLPLLLAGRGPARMGSAGEEFHGKHDAGVLPALLLQLLSSRGLNGFLQTQPPAPLAELGWCACCHATAGLPRALPGGEDEDLGESVRGPGDAVSEDRARTTVSGWFVTIGSPCIDGTRQDGSGAVQRTSTLVGDA